MKSLNTALSSSLVRAYAPSANRCFSHGYCLRTPYRMSCAHALSDTSAVVRFSISRRPSVSTTMCRLRPTVFLAAWASAARSGPTPRRSGQSDTAWSCVQCRPSGHCSLGSISQASITTAAAATTILKRALTALERTGMIGRSPVDKALMVFRPLGSSTSGLAQRGRNIVETVAGHILGLVEKLQWAS